LDKNDFIRISLEKAAGPLILQKINPESLKELRNINRDFEEASRRNDSVALILANLAFHRRLSEVSGNSFLCQFLEISRLQTHQGRYISWLDKKRVRESLRDHKDMLSALARKDLAKFETATLRHQEAGKRDYQKIFSTQRNWYMDSNRTSSLRSDQDIRSPAVKKELGKRLNQSVEEKKIVLFPSCSESN
jgi:DNA-binding GntR family transcriptional regulator